MRRILYLLIVWPILANAQFNTDRLVMIGRSALYYEDYVLSIQYFNQAISQKPWLYEPWFFRGVAKYYLDDYRGAENDCTEAIERNPYVVSAYELRGLCRISQKKFSEAVLDYDKALRYDPENQGLWHNRILCLIQDKNYDRALAEIDTMTTHWSKYARAYAMQAEVYLLQEDTVKAVQSLDKSLTNASQNNISIEKLVDQINESNQYIRHLVEVKSKSDSLNMVLTNNLTRSLSKEELKEVDVQVLKGVVYISLADNMLYKSGSYEINSRAAETLSKIAKIIKDYKDYDVLIEGNTDNVPIKKTNIRNNWDLSTLRASSVVQALQNDYGVDPKRLTAGGRGEYNPIASNDTEIGKQRNRRTQIIITPKLDEFMDLIGQAPESDK